MRGICKNLSEAKKLTSTITALTIIILICCNPSPHHHKMLPVPFLSQWYNGWCGAACIQMWAYYDGRDPSQDDVASFIGWTISNVWAIADGVTYFTNSTGYPRLFGSSQYQQDLAMSTQVASVEDDVPSISIVDGGTHAVIIKGFDWTDTSTGPRADGVSFHDPWRGPNWYQTAGEWKHAWFTAYNGEHLIVLGAFRYVSEGESGYANFLNQGGTYYGGPENYEPQE